MPTATRQPIGRRIQRRVSRAVNVPMRFMLGLPFATPPGGRLMLVFLIGRKTGKSYRQPVSYVRDGDALLTPGGGRWKLNLSEGKPVRIRLRGKDVMARPEIIADPGEVERLLGVMTAASPMAGRFVAIPKGPDGRLDRDRLDAALTYGFRVIRWHLDDAGTGRSAPAEEAPRVLTRRAARHRMLRACWAPNRRCHLQGRRVAVPGW